MRARDASRPRSAPRGVRLPSAVQDAIQAEADARGLSWSALTAELLEEGIRQRRAPGITFVDGATGRRPVVAGTGLDVWEVIASWKDLGEQTFEALPWLSEMQVRAALGYYELYPVEIDERLRVEESWTLGRVRAELPFAAPRRA